MRQSDECGVEKKLVFASVVMLTLLTLGVGSNTWAQSVPDGAECAALKRKSPMYATYCTTCSRSQGADRAACENYWNYLDPSRIKNAKKRREKENAAAAKQGTLWTSLGRPGICSFVASNNRGYRELSAELDLRSLENGFFRSPLSFGISQSWSHDGGTVRGDAFLSAQVLPSSHVYLYLRNRSSSDKFKYFANPSQITLFANSDRRLIRHPERIGMGTVEGFNAATSLSHLNARLGGQRTSRKEDVQRVVASPECDVSYLLMKYQFCGRVQTFGRSWAAGFCGGGTKASEIAFFRGFSYQDWVEAERHLQSVDLAVGEVAALVGSLPAAAAPATGSDGSVWRIIRVQ